MALRNLSCVLLVLLAAVGAAGPGFHPARSEEKPAEPPVVRKAQCRWAAQPITLDGKLDEPSWGKAEVLSAFAVFWQGRSAKTPTMARLLWDRDNLYFAAAMEDADLYADVTEHNGMCWLNDVFELFFKPKDDAPAYYEFQVNAANTQLELYLPSRGSGGYTRFAKAGKLGLASAVQPQGTLNRYEDRDTGWVVEGKIPWTAFAKTGGAPQPGDSWRFALCRYDYSVTLEQPELSCTAPLTRPDFHYYEDYGRLTFTGPERQAPRRVQ